MSWQKLTLRDISLNIQTGPFGSQLHQSDYSEEGTPVVMPKDLIEGKISEESIARVEEVHVNRLLKHKIEAGDILYARRGDVGKCAFATEREKGWLCGTGCIRITVNTNVANPQFLFYQLQKPETVGWIEKHAIGATMLNLNTAILSAVPIELPQMAIQNKVVDILKAYDDLIENNQKQIKLLEEVAQRLYKEWFVDFRFPNYVECIIVDGIPNGWKKVGIDEAFDIKYGKTLPVSMISSKGKYPVYGANGIIGYYDQKNCDECVALITSRGNGSGDVLRTHDAESFVTNNSFIVKGKEDYLCMPFSYEIMLHTNFKSVCTGSAQPQLTNNSISTLDIIIPRMQVIRKYNEIAVNWFNKIEVMLQQNKKIIEARKRLLPKLMNGEIEV